MLYSLRYFMSTFGLCEQPDVQPGDGDEGAHATELTDHD